MAPLAVDPAALDSAGGAVVAAGAGLGVVISSLTAALAGCAGMAGDDPAGAVFGRSYDGSAAALVQAMSVARNGLCNLGDGVRMSAHNYSLAEAMSDVAGRAAPLPAPPPSGCVGVGAPPSAVGGGGGAPKGWGWVAPYIGMIWPNGDSTKLRAAAVAWRSAGTQFALTEIQSTAGPMGVIRAQQLPEAGLIESAFADAYASTTAVVGQCHQLAAQLDAYAARIDAVHAAVLDLLARICDPLTGIKEVWEFLTDQDEDEIQRIAHDIAVVVDQFSGEVDALAAEITAVVSHAEAVITAMADHAGKQWDRFLHSNPVGVVIDGTGQQLKGFGEEAFGMAKDSWDLGPLRASIDPFGWYRSWEEMLTGMAPLAGLGGENAPGVVESWKQFGKSLIHWDEWTTNPNEALGKTVFDAATLALPGGPLSKLGSKGRDILAGVRGLKERLEPTTPHLEPPATPPRPGPQPPRIEPPESGHPAPAPAAKPAPVPANGPLPHSPTESKPPPVDRPAVSEPPKRAAIAPPPAGPPRVSAPSHDHLLPVHSEPPAPTPAQVPANTPLRGSPCEPTPVAAHPPPAVPAAATSHALPPHSPIPADHPPEPQPHGGRPYGGGQSPVEKPSGPSGLDYEDYGSEWDVEGPDGLAGSIRTVNPGGGTMNCVNCAITTDQMLDGIKISAALDGPKPIGFLENYFGSHFAPIADRAAIEVTMTAAGDGARGIVFASRGPGQVGHVFNVVNQNGVIRFLDGQPGRVASFDGYKSFYFMRYR
ncbi:toxin glutamine deamidase domain-containing protein [Mycobacterium canetti]|uniref:toxin glutamine deamidase domain-containing protein n=1 Tax=Mycobacterium canetti TaxID=78331 RepID=UPI0002A5B6B6|nr:toxin glutamine deamidase domain-containing protein [Mycobacterium canetti]CCK66137.1 Conserved protein of unknown function [Mycobacterium canettii CIPT 140070017]